MKTLSCDLCSTSVQAKTFEEWMDKMKPHYAEAHQDFMKQNSTDTDEEKMVGMQKWMVDNKARFEAV